MTGHMPAELRRELEARAAATSGRSSVVKRTIEQSHCVLCNHTWPYSPGDDTKPCPACGSGNNKSWGLDNPGASE